jgi:UDP-2,3-diacylglucosamine hydrolase
MFTTQKIGLIAGQGDLPIALLKKWEQSCIIPVIVGLHGITSPSIADGKIIKFFSIGQAGGILGFLKSEGVAQVVMVGGLKRPNFWTLRTDKVGFQIVLKLLFRRMGDDGLLKFIRREIEKFGIQVVGVHEYLPEILSPKGVLGDIHPTSEEKALIAKGFEAAKKHGAEDKGQSVVVTYDGEIGFETQQGTNALISSYINSKGSVLVKTSKPQQDLAFDMPTIGLKTIELAHQSGFKGVAVEAAKSIIMDKQRVIELCNRYGMFLIGIEEKDAN